MKTILITGAAGFVGRSLLEGLSSTTYNLIALKRADLNLLDKSAVDNFFNTHQIDYVFHCANQGGSRVTGYDNHATDVVMSNLKMFYNLASNLNDNQKLISFGSGAEYNKSRDLIKISEDKIGEVMPADPYGFSKLVTAKFIEKSDNIISPIIFGLFGKFEDYRFKFITNAIIKNLFKLPVVINQNVVFDYLFIDDFVNIMQLLIENTYDLKSFNITPNESIDLVKIVNIINEISDYKSEIIIKSKGLNFEYTGSNSVMKSKIGDYQFIPYYDSILHLYNYFKSILNSINYEEIATDEYISFCKTKTQ